jgi:hypothetical protein
VINRALQDEFTQGLIEKNTVPHGIFSKLEIRVLDGDPVPREFIKPRVLELETRFTRADSGGVLEIRPLNERVP